MPMNPVMLAAIKALSYSDEYLVKNYKVERKIDELIHPKLTKPSYRFWDRAITREGHGIPVRLFFPSEEGAYPLIIFFHGGGFVKGNIDSYSNVCMHMAQQTKHIVLSVDYRLAPEAPFPVGLEDCYRVVQEVLKYPELFGVKSEDVTLVGDSAGANLAATVSLMARDRKALQVNKQILIYPVVYNDHSESSPYKSVKENGEDYLLTAKRIQNYVSLYIQDKKELQNPYFAPLLADNLEDQPDTLIITAMFDPLRDEGEAYGEKLKAWGNRVEIHRMPDAIHGFFSLPPVFDTVKETYNLMNSFLSRR